MMLRSMTGFGRSEGQLDGVGWNWELRAVNGKNLDIRLRLPSGYERMEQVAKKQIAEEISRGNLQVSLSLGRRGGATATVLNEDMLERVIAAIEKIESISQRAPSSAADILAIRGVLDTNDAELGEDQQKKLEAMMLESLRQATAALNQNREQEGAALSTILLGLVRQVKDLTDAAENDPSRSSEAIAERLQEQLNRIDGLNGELDGERLHQEVALLATKADIREELDRLAAHTTAAADLIRNGSPIGRKLEFLAQEFNRECNTLCSKSNAVSLTNIGLELKVVIDQFREQCLNVE
ncbi:MAG: YicC family protein [Rhizobiaceae bacterium]|nr:YicC family protein [Rhizobiaceae bacterium]